MHTGIRTEWCIILVFTIEKTQLDKLSDKKEHVDPLMTTEDDGGSKRPNWIDPTARNSEDSDNLGGISFEDIINPEPDVVLSKLSDKKEHVDPLMITEDDGERPEKRVKREITSSVFENSIILSPSVNNNVIQNKIVTSTGSSGSALVKIAPRTAVTAMGTTTTSMTTNGKIIYLHRSGGTTVPVRVPATIGTPTSGSNGAKPAVAIQLIRAPHTVIPVKAGKSINIPNVSQLAGKKMITTGGDGAGGQVVIKGPIKKVSGGMLSGSSTLSTSVGSTIISPVEGGKSNVRQLIASKTALTSTSNGSASGSGKVLVQNTTGTRQVMVPQNVIKISPNSPRGQLQAIQIPGKPGLQYVRVLGNSSGVTQKVNAQESNASPHYTVVRHTKPGMKLVVKSAVGDKDRKTMTTVPTLRKITDHIVVKPNDAGDNKVVRTQKISQINSQIQRFSTPGDSKGVNMPGSKIFVVSKSIIQGTVTSQNQNASSGQQRQSVATQKDANDGSDSPTSSKKLYSVLRPVTEQKEIKLKARVDPVPTKPPAAPTLPASNVNNVKQQPISRSSPVLSDDAVTIRRKHCNCTKSQCLKLYCDCFANGEFCQDCNCKDCLNNLDNEDERQKAIRICLERNPNSFKPKITAATNESDLRLHNKGCNCKRSGCLKNYCECYEAKIPCSSNCKCVGCRNVEDHPDLDMDVKKGPVSHVQTYSRVKRTYDDMAKPRTQAIQPTTTSSSSVPAGTTAVVSNATAIGSTLGPTGEKQSCNFITQEVVDATIQCLVAQADECNKSSLTQYQTEKMIMEELGRCLVEIIDFSIRNTGQN